MGVSTHSCSTPASGYAGVGAFWEVPAAEFDEVFATNVRGAWLCAKAADRLWREVVRSWSWPRCRASSVYPGETIYSSSKGAVLQLARGMAGDLAEHGIASMPCVPGSATRRSRAGSSTGPATTAAVEAEYAAAAPLGRMGSADEIARATLFLASDQSSFTTGASLVCDGGVTIR